MFPDQKQARRASNEAKALQRKANRQGNTLSGGERARLERVRGRAVRYSEFEPEGFDNRHED